MTDERRKELRDHGEKKERFEGGEKRRPVSRILKLYFIELKRFEVYWCDQCQILVTTGGGMGRLLEHLSICHPYALRARKNRIEAIKAQSASASNLV